jgi:hypothetical protein
LIPSCSELCQQNRQDLAAGCLVSCSIALNPRNEKSTRIAEPTQHIVHDGTLESKVKKPVSTQELGQLPDKPQIQPGWVEPHLRELSDAAGDSN